MNSCTCLLSAHVSCGLNCFYIQNDKTESKGKKTAVHNKASVQLAYMDQPQISCLAAVLAWLSQINVTPHF